MLGKVCKAWYARQGMLGKACKTRYARQGMLGKKCKTRYASQSMQGKLCKARYVRQGNVYIEKKTLAIISEGLHIILVNNKSDNFQVFTK